RNLTDVYPTIFESNLEARPSRRHIDVSSAIVVIPAEILANLIYIFCYRTACCEYGIRMLENPKEGVTHETDDLAAFFLNCVDASVQNIPDKIRADVCRILFNHRCEIVDVHDERKSRDRRLCRQLDRDVHCFVFWRRIHSNMVVRRYRKIAFTSPYAVLE